MSDVTLAVGTKTETQSVTPGEVFNQTLKLAAAASDTSLTLGTLTDPKFIAVYGGEGISFKLGSGGTDAITADPMAIICADNDGIGESIILLSNSSASEVVVYVYAEE